MISSFDNSRTDLLASLSSYRIVRNQYLDQYSEIEIL